MSENTPKQNFYAGTFLLGVVAVVSAIWIAFGPSAGIGAAGVFAIVLGSVGMQSP